jgi:flagellar hook-associated protein 2
VNQLVDAARVPVEKRYTQQEGVLREELSALGSLNSTLATFQNALSGASSFSTFQSVSVASSDSSVVSASGSSVAVPGSYSLEVTTLARAQSLASKAFATTTDPIGTGTLTFQFGTFSGGVFAANADKAIQSVDISITDNSVQGIRDAVNAANVGVRASIVDDGTGNRLVFSSVESGAANSLKITVADSSDASDTDDAGLSQLAYDPEAAVGFGKNQTETVTATDAVFKVNGLDITRSSNTVTGVVAGVTLTLKAVTAGAPATVTVAQDNTATNKAISDFVSGFNQLKSMIGGLTSISKATGKAGVLIGDSTVRTIESRVNAIVFSDRSSVGGSYTSLASIGLTTDSEGLLTINGAKLAEAITTDRAAVGKLFAAIGTPSDSLVNYVSATADTAVGDYAVEVTQLATQGSYAGAASAGFPLDITADNDTLAIEVDGVSSGTITLSQKVGYTSTELAAELQSRINGDSALLAVGSSVTVAYVTDHFEILSTRYGSASKVNIKAIDATTTASMGLAVTNGTDGVDVAGTIGGLAATGSGRFLTGSGDAVGLKMEITGGITGSRGTLAFSRGLGDLLSSIMAKFLGTDNIIGTRTDGIDSRLSDLTDKREVLTRKMEALEIRYLRQFNALDTMMAQMRSTSDYLTQQLDALPGAYVKK